MSPSIRIAIAGGGLAGATLVHALLPHAHLDVHIFESAPAFKEAGLSIGIARNALAALELIGSSAVQCLDRAGAFPQKRLRAMLAQGQGAGQMIDEMEKTQHFSRSVSRADFLRELLVDVPQERMHASKKLDKVEQGESIKLCFIDGTTHECDILIGADGLHSTVRKLVLGKEDPACFPRNGGWWNVMTLKSYEEAHASIGDDMNLDGALQVAWIGDGTFLLHNILSRGQLVQIVIAVYDEASKQSEGWGQTVTADEIKSLYKEWPPGIYKAVEQLLCDKPEHNAIYLRELPPARTYVSGPLCVMGDAAHATTPWQGAGGGMSIEDSLILSTLLGRVKMPAEAQIALRVYDQVRRPRTQRLVESSRGTGLIMSGRGEETKLDSEKIKANLFHRWNFILDFDVKKHRDDALEILENELLKA